MTQYLITTFTDSIGHTHAHVTKARDNQTFTVVEAESKEEAKRKYNELIQCPRCKSWNADNQFVHDNNKPIFTYFICYNCDATYAEYMKGQ